MDAKVKHWSLGMAALLGAACGAAIYSSSNGSPVDLGRLILVLIGSALLFTGVAWLRNRFVTRR